MAAVIEYILINAPNTGWYPAERKSCVMTGPLAVVLPETHGVPRGDCRGAFPLGGWMAVKDYLDPRWQAKRLRIMERDRFTCMCCLSSDKTLNVHHRAYRKGARIWEVENEDLVTLCEDCHESVESMVRNVRMIGDRLQHMRQIKLADRDPIELLADLSLEVCRNPMWGFEAMKKVENLITSLILSSPSASEMGGV